MPGKWPVLLLVQCAGVLFPLTFIPLGVWGGHSFDFSILCAVVQSAVIYYGKDLFDRTKWAFLRSLVTFFVTSLAIGVSGSVVYPQEIWLHDGSCCPFGGPITTFFAEFHLLNLPIALAICPLWMMIRWAEKAARSLLAR
jgi:hypothetical protein